MSAYIVATVQITDPERFADYGRAVAGLSERFGGSAVVRGQVQEVLEGDSPVGERVVVVRFPDAESARRYIGSAEYQGARALRESAAKVSMRLLVD